MFLKYNRNKFLKSNNLKTKLMIYSEYRRKWNNFKFVFMSCENQLYISLLTISLF